jgi:diacylglycerol kinase family enzyme
MAMKNILLVGNPTAQSGKNAARIEQARARFAELGTKVGFFSTLPAGATVPALTGELDAGAFDVVVAMGGDGTFREVGAAILASKNKESLALGMLPTGTANDQGRSFGLSASPDSLFHNIEVVLAGHETRIDAGRLTVWDGGAEPVSDALFFDSAGFGISARVLRQRNEDRKLVDELGPIKELYRDQLVYAGALLRTFAESYILSDKFDAIGTVDGEPVELRGLIDLVFKNTRIYGGAWIFDPTSRHDDGLFEIVPFLGKRDWASKAIVDLAGNPLTEEVLNQIGVEHSKNLRGGRVELTLVPPADVPLHGQVDGEELRAGTRVVLEVLPRALRLVVPREHSREQPQKT